MDAQVPEGRSLPIEWYIPENIVTRYATDMVVQSSPLEFVISFFEAYPPLLIGTPEEAKAQAEKLDSIRATCIARFIVSPGKITEFVAVLQQSLEQYQSSFGKLE